MKSQKIQLTLSKKQFNILYKALLHFEKYGTVNSSEESITLVEVEEVLNIIDYIIHGPTDFTKEEQ